MVFLNTGTIWPVFSMDENFSWQMQLLKTDKIYGNTTSAASLRAHVSIFYNYDEELQLEDLISM